VVLQFHVKIYLFPGCWSYIFPVATELIHARIAPDIELVDIVRYPFRIEAGSGRLAPPRCPAVRAVVMSHYEVGLERAIAVRPSVPKEE
jgi:hypothetical protein